MRKGEQLMLEAASKMSGESKELSKVMTVNQFADVVETIANLCMKDTKASVLKKLQEVQDLLRSGNSSYEELMKILWVRERNAGTICGSELQPTELHKLRLRQQSEKLYAMYDGGDSFEEAQKAMEEIMEQFPTLPEHRLIYRSAEHVAIYFDNYMGNWKTAGNTNGSAIAWAGNGKELYLVHFTNNIFDSGMIIPGDAFSVFSRFYITHEANNVVPNDKEYGEINFRIAEEDFNAFVIYLDDIRVMTLTRDMMERVSASIGCDDAMSWIVIDRFKSMLVH